MNLNLVSTSVGQGPNLVLLHGWGLNSGVWHAILPLLSRHFCVTTIDLPGFGLNHAKMPTPYNVLTVSQAVAAALPSNAILLGWSLGGLIAQQIAAFAPQKIKKLILLASTPKFLADEGWPGISGKVLDNFKSQLINNLSVTVSRFLAIQSMGSPSAKQDTKLIKQYVDAYPAAHPEALSAGLDILKQCDLRKELLRLTLPCSLLLGRLDSLVPLKVSTQIALLNPKIDITVFERSSHAPFISQSSDFIKILVNKDV